MKVRFLKMNEEEPHFKVLADITTLQKIHFMKVSLKMLNQMDMDVLFTIQDVQMKNMHLMLISSLANLIILVSSKMEREKAKELCIFKMKTKRNRKVSGKKINSLKLILHQKLVVIPTSVEIETQH